MREQRQGGSPVRRAGRPARGGAPGLDPDAVADAERAAATLAEVEAEVEAERAAEAAADESAGRGPCGAPRARAAADRRVRQALAAFGPTDLHAVEDARDQRARRAPVDELVPVPEAQALADEIARRRGAAAGRPGHDRRRRRPRRGRTRLDDARHALLVAEQAVRNPELDRGMVDRLEQAHAELLDAIDKADSRFGGARAQQRVEALRIAEHAILDEMGFTSYSDYMMGYSLLHVDPEKEAALDAARAELASAEDAWHALEAETDAELARAELVERRRLLLEQADRWSGGPCRRGPSSSRSERSAWTRRRPSRSPTGCASPWTRPGWSSVTRSSIATTC